MTPDILLGRLDASALPWHEITEAENRLQLLSGIVGLAAALLAVVAALAVAAILTRRRGWGPLWRDWATSLDHKKIGIMYVVVAFAMLARGVAEAAVMRLQQALGADGGGILTPDHFGQLFSTHGTIMIFFVAMPFLTGLINFVMPMQIGARDVSFPLLNSVSLGLTVAGAALVMISLVIQPFSTGGWSGYPPFTEISFQPGAGPDYWIWAVTLSSLGSTLSGINFTVTIYKERCEGMRLMRMPMFCWTSLCTSILMIFAMPPLTVATGLLALDRYLGFHVFTNDGGGNVMLFANLFWLFGHPEVYILILPAFGVWSEVFSTFSGKGIYGYFTLVLATMCIAVLSFTVWVHHFFTMGQSADLNAVFGIATMTISIPTGVKIYDWMLTMYRGRVRITVPMVYAVGFLFLFVLGGMSGVLLANPSIDFQVHNTLFLVAHFHNMLIPGTLFGMIAGYTLWFPKAFGFRLDDRWGYRAAGLWIVGFILAFFPLYLLGLMGMPRRLVGFFEEGWLPLTLAALAGAGCIVLAVIALGVQLAVSIRRREALAVPVGDPWDGRSLEWALPAPAPEWNFPTDPVVNGRDAFMQLKRQGGHLDRPEGGFGDIRVPRESAIGPIVAVAGTAAGFALTWYIWWLAALSVAVIVGAMIARGFVRDAWRTIPAATVEAHWTAWRALADATPRVRRSDELRPANRGHAVPAAEERST
ncbi:cbb3-type cytochrome c oxidase subunit I [Falsirhodobacter algicola]|uniref:Cytochrome ubiquinol oxidase subunit I n=1 Tax=Falsirhodobacter algicola TaxID=2692330 RepID=A0A8J8MU52_9RHOB|nr:cbb3-type cytochrome c oxidase subunit I [Falsirhodobacter algicola]QUS36456.1 cytochrome ubiquinol oxidase subunit I [Falsirhodobacter algicola]